MIRQGSYLSKRIALQEWITQALADKLQTNVSLGEDMLSLSDRLEVIMGRYPGVSLVLDEDDDKYIVQIVYDSLREKFISDLEKDIIEEIQIDFVYDSSEQKGDSYYIMFTQKGDK